MESKIEILSREWIKPSTPTPHNKKEHKLSLADHLQPNKFVSLLLIFDQNHQENPSKETQHLKQSLSNCLTKFYPLAGKIARPAGILTVECDDTGALFVEAKVSAPMSEALHNNGSWEKFGLLLPFEPFINYDELITIPRFSSSPSSSSSSFSYPKNKIPLSIQVTRFECGGTAIGVCLLHKIGDTASLLTFLSSWTAENRGFPMKQPAVNFDIGRSVFPCSPTSFDNIRKLNNAGPAKLIGENKVVSKRFVFSKEKITQLKELAVSCSSVVSPTRVEVVASFLWKQFIHVQPRKGPTYRVTHAVNLRGKISRLAPAADDEFAFGNIVTLAPAAFTDDDDDNGVSYGDLVGATRDAFKKINMEHAMAILSLFESCESLQDVWKTTEVISGWSCSSLCRFPIHDLDFGWGKPVSVGPAGVRAHIGVVLTATADGDGIIAWVTLPEEEMSLLPEELLSLQATHFMDSF